MDLTPGIYPGVSRAEYDRIEAVNHSRLKLMRRSPLHCREGVTTESDAMTLGTLVHAYLLEPERFGRSHVVMPDLTVGITTKEGKPAAAPKATAEYKARLSKFGQENIGKTFVDSEDWEACQRIGEAIAAHATATAILTEPADTEVLVLWQDPHTGLWCKALVDHLARNGQRLTDLKTTTDASPATFGRSSATFGYHTQAAFYMWGLAVLGRPVVDCLHVVVETERPHGIAVYAFDDEAIDQGLRSCQTWLRQYATCEQVGHWHGYPDTVGTLSLPKWAITNERVES